MEEYGEWVLLLFPLEFHKLEGGASFLVRQGKHTSMALMLSQPGLAAALGLSCLLAAQLGDRFGCSGRNLQLRLPASGFPCDVRAFLKRIAQ